MSNPSNLLLASLSASDAAALQPHLKAVHLEHEQILFEAGEKVAAIYFPTGRGYLACGRPFIRGGNRSRNGRQGWGGRRSRSYWRKHSQQSRNRPTRRNCDDVRCGRAQKRGNAKPFLIVGAGPS